MERSRHTPYSEVEGKKLNLRFVDLGQIEVKSSVVVGFCHYQYHRGFLDSQSLKKHKCVKKQCPSLEKFKDYPYWKNIAAQKQERDKRHFEEKHQAKLNAMLDAAIEKACLEDSTETFKDVKIVMQVLCRQFGYKLSITKVKRFCFRDTEYFIVFYISKNNFDDKKHYEKLEIRLTKAYHKNIYLKREMLPNGEYALPEHLDMINGGITMDITPIYELKSRLRAAAIAGTNLLSEDFRLKKAAENFAALAGSSPVFAKINEMTGKLLAEPSPEGLLDTITLVDAVITTLATVGTSGELEPIEIEGNSSAIVSAPYSQLSPIIEALTTSGSGNYNTILTARNETPEVFRDYRVKPVLVRGLGASYAELADTVANILKGMGKEIIPLVKKDFDPKGKKETVRRLNVIEEVCGAEENEFYLEQLENAEKDVRKALIYALRHDEENIDKLIELTKTEKGKPKTAALAALISFDSEKSAAFFEEYARKKPAEVISALQKASSKWTSELTARLIDAALIDENGNKVTLSQVAADGKLKLKSKTSYWDMNAALWGKWGEDIEKIYREFRCDSNTPIAVGMDMRLEETILVTNDEGLKSLAKELNSAPKTKGIYAGAEAAARLLSEEDSSDWLAKQIMSEFKKRETKTQHLTNSGIVKTLQKIYFKDGKYYLINRCYDPINDGWIMNSPREVIQPIKGAVSDALMKCSCWEYDRILADLIDESDKEYCQKIGEHFCDNIRGFNGTGFNDISTWCGIIKRCGFYNVKNLAADYFKSITGKSYTSWVQSILQYVPGDDDYKLAEARAIIEIARKKKRDWFSIEEFETWVNSNYDHH